MSWKNIKTFLILLFVIINLYLVFTTHGLFKKPTVTYIDKDTISDVTGIVDRNYNVKVNKDAVPTKIKNLKSVDVTNIIFTDTFRKSGFDFKIDGARFETIIKTDTFSYNEDNARKQVTDIVKKLGISPDTYNISTYKDDEGLVCRVNGKILDYPLFNSGIKAVCVSSEIKLSGTWYITTVKEEKQLSTSSKMTDITSVIIDASVSCSKSDGSQTEITDVDYGYYVLSYDEKIASKTSPAIPCYMIKTDEGFKYYYDATNGKSIKQED